MINTMRPHIPIWESKPCKVRGYRVNFNIERDSNGPINYMALYLKAQIGH